MKTLKHILTIILVAVFSMILINCAKDKDLVQKVQEVHLKKSIDFFKIMELFNIEEGIAVFGPETFVRNTSELQIITKEFEIGNYEQFKDTFLIVIESGDEYGNFRVTSAVVKVDNRDIFVPSNFSNRVGLLAQILTLGHNGKIELELRGAPNSYIKIKVLGWLKDDLTVTDIDGNVYQTVKIGDQVWMAENLKTTRYQNGDLIGAWAYDGIESNADIYGRLYTWYEVTDSRVICPEGWHVPTDAEWTTLLDYLINNGYAYDDPSLGGAIAKSLASTSGWDISNNPNPACIGIDQENNNSSGFTGLPGGVGLQYGFSYMGSSAYWWSSSKSTGSIPDQAISYYMSSNYWGVWRNGTFKSQAMSVRCIKD